MQHSYIHTEYQAHQTSTHPIGVVTASPQNLFPTESQLLADSYAMQQGVRVAAQHPQQTTALANPQQQALAESYAMQQGLQLVAQHAQQTTASANPQQQALADAYAMQQGLQLVAQHPQQTGAPANPQQQAAPASRTRFAEVPNTVPLTSGVERLDPAIVQELLRSGSCVLVDVRGDDRACGTIDGAINVRAIDKVPFNARVPDLVQSWKHHPLIIFHCQYSAHRAPQCANWYREQAAQSQRVAIMDGGFRGWEASGLPVHGGSGQTCNLVHGAQTHGSVPQVMQAPLQMQAFLQPLPILA